MHIQHAVNIYLTWQPLTDLCHAVFLTSTFEGEPRETEEMTPQWFSIDQIPYQQMWEDDPLWYPLLLQGKYFVGNFDFRDRTMLRHSLSEVDRRLLPEVKL